MELQQIVGLRIFLANIMSLKSHIFVLFILQYCFLIHCFVFILLTLFVLHMGTCWIPGCVVLRDLCLEQDIQSPVCVLTRLCIPWTSRQVLSSRVTCTLGHKKKSLQWPAKTFIALIDHLLTRV